ncbi:MAG: ABC transporter substrate-binding protein [Microbacterium sp.]|uniref:ABC transporter substrate-binding protein n=1 Tax=Microbacterium sp. TaxID=51671 RepID=UPI0039E61C0F
MNVRIPLAAAALTVTALALTACDGGSDTSAGTDLTPVTAIVSNPFSVGQFYGLYLLGEQKGFFEDEGIDVTFQEGTGSATSAQVVAAGNADFGLNIGLVAVVNNDDSGADLKIVARDSAVSTYAVVSLGAEIEDPSDLIGKTIGLPEGTTQAILWSTFLTEAGIDPSEVSTVNVSPANAVTTLAQGRVDGIVTYETSAVPALAELGEDDPSVLSFNDYGVEVIPDAGVVASGTTIEENPELVEHFVAAVEKSIAYAIEHPDEIYSAGSAAYPDSFTEGVVSGQTAISAQAFADTTADDQPYVYTDLDALTSTLEMLRSGGVLSAAGDAETYATNDFVPAQR